MKKSAFSIIVLLSFVVTMQAQKVEIKKTTKEEKLYVKVKEGEKPVIYVDGKKFDFPIELIDQTKIQSMSVLNHENAAKMYNEPNGVILIKTKITEEIIAPELHIVANKNLVSKNKPMIIIDGEITTQEVLGNLLPENIESVDVVKGEKALKEYNAPNGVIIITKKKKNKK
jgi:hypothetical protein